MLEPNPAGMWCCGGSARTSHQVAIRVTNKPNGGKTWKHHKDKPSSYMYSRDSNEFISYAFQIYSITFTLKKNFT